MINRHAVPKYTGYQLCVVPILGIELLTQPFNGGLIASFVFKLEIIAVCSVIISLLNNLSFGYIFG